MKKLICIVLCLCLGLSSLPVALAEDEYIPPELLNLPDSAGGISWISNQTHMENIVTSLNNRYIPDESIYDIARNSVIIWTGNRTAYVNGYRTYIGSTDSEIFVQDGTLYVPAESMGTALVMRCIIEGNVVTLKGYRTLVFNVGEKRIYVNGTAQSAPAAPIIRNDEIFLPVRAAAEAAGKTVIYDNRGFTVIASASVISRIEEKHLAEMAKPTLYLEREKIAFPHPDSVMEEMFYGSSAFMSYTDAQIDPLIEEYMDMTYKELAEAIDSAVANRHFGSRPDFERPVALMAIKYNRNPDEDLALRIIIMLYHSALGFDSQDKEYLDFFNNYDYVIPKNLVYAYDKIYHSPMWDVVSRGYGTDVKVAVANWWRTLFDYVIVNKKGKPVGNYPRVYTYMAGVATALDDPDRMRDVVERIDMAVTPYSYFADGMWYEGSASYVSSATDYPMAAARVVKAYHDRRCYKDNIYSINLNGNFDIVPRWTDFLQRAATAPNDLYFPDGSPIAINDTDWQSVSKNLADNTPKEKYLSKNIEMNHFGLYGLRYGDTEEAQQLNLSVQAVTSVSHQQNAPLGISYYSGGIELLPDIGYVNDPAAYRYSKTTAFAHNTAWSGGTPPSHAVVGSLYARPNVLAYDDGSTNGKQIQLVEGSNLMPGIYGFDTNRRLVMMIATDENHSYAVDIHRMRGNTVHESYLIQNEEEDAQLTTSLSLPDAYSGKLTSWLTSKGKRGGLMLDHDYSYVITNPRGVITDDDFSFNLTGATATLNAFIKGNDDMTVAFSTWPTSRRANNNPAKKDDYPGYHLYRRNDVQEGEASIFGGVYEGVKKGETARVSNVTWYTPADGNDMTTMLAVEQGNYIDYIYVSNDLTQRSFAQFTMSGNVAVVRTRKDSGEVVFGYIYGDGSISAAGFTLAGKDDLSYTVQAAQDANKSITLSGSPSAEIAGLWGNVSFSDGSGTAYKVEKVNQDILTLNSAPGFKMTNKGAEFTAYPLYEDHASGKVAEFAYPYTEGMEKRYRDGDVVFTVKIPTFFNAGN